MVEDKGGRESQAGGGRDAVSELDGGEGVEPQRAEGLLSVDGFGAGMTEHGGHVSADDIEKGLLLFLGRTLCQLLAKRVGGGRGGIAA
ncbi:hypothetical protein SAZ11_62645 [Streptomyces sp. FXJ1.4098]|nr:hypothetical protein [Streptomyces sp. FXJ1.4098]